MAQCIHVLKIGDREIACLRSTGHAGSHIHTGRMGGREVQITFDNPRSVENVAQEAIQRLFDIAEKVHTYNPAFARGVRATAMGLITDLDAAVK